MSRSEIADEAPELMETTDLSVIRNNAMLLERARIAGVIHEGVTQVLTNVAIQMEVFEKSLDDPASSRKMLVSMRTAVLDALDTLRGAILELTPPDPAWTDLATGLRRFAGDFSAQWGTDIRFHVSGDPREVAPETVALAFAFVQESLSNVRKHAGPASVEMELSFLSDSVTVAVVDDGVGFSSDEVREDSFRRHQGLQLLRARVRLEGAAMKVRSTPGKGTSVVLTVRDRKAEP